MLRFEPYMLCLRVAILRSNGMTYPPTRTSRRRVQSILSSEFEVRVKSVRERIRTQAFQEGWEEVSTIKFTLIITNGYHQ